MISTARGWCGRRSRVLLAAALVAVLVGGGRAAAGAQRPADLTELSLEDLMRLEVTTLSRRPERRSTVAAAVYVISGEEIRRSGVTTIPDALRLAPGMQVARVDANKWAVGVRGFASRLARSVLVLIDGRSVYTPLFAGTYWEVQDTVLEDIDRIEIIRGPGGALWGANAVNGIINIITKSARATQGGLLRAGGGNEEQGFASVRYGGALGERFHWRVYGKYFNRDSGFNPDGPAYDDWHMTREGFRADWDASARDLVTVQGDVYDGDAGQRVAITELTPPFQRIATEDGDLAGGNVLGRWSRVLSDTSDLALQVYFDNTFRQEPSFHERRNTWDVDFQHHATLAERHDVVWGLGYRHTADRVGSVPTIVFDPHARADDLFTWFVQDEIALLEQVRLTLGAKFEHNDYSGFELQPSLRAVWTPHRRHSLWAAVSRAVRTPSRVEHDLELIANFPGTDRFARLIGDEAFVSEKVVAYEAGYRVEPIDQLFLDLALFYNDYDDLLSVEPRPPMDEPTPGGVRSIQPFFFRNRVHGETYGLEIAADSAVAEWWRLHGAYSLVKIELRRDPGGQDPNQGTEGASPRHQVAVRSTMDLPAGVQLDAVVRYVDNLPAQNIESYVALDLRLAKEVIENVELAVVGQNVTDDHHREFAGGTEVERSIYGQVRVAW